MCQKKEKQQYIADGTVGTVIESSAKHQQSLGYRGVCVCACVCLCVHVCITVSQICSLICFPSIVIILAPNSTPSTHRLEHTHRYSHTYTPRHNMYTHKKCVCLRARACGGVTYGEVMNWLEPLVCEL